MSEPAIQINMNEPGARAIMAQLRRANEELGKPIRQAIQWAGYYVSRSLGARTKVAPKLRKIIKNPDTRWKTDLRRAVYGVNVYRGGVEQFRPIYRTNAQRFNPNDNNAAYRVIRYRDKKTWQYVQWDRTKPAGHPESWITMPSRPDPANPEIEIPGIMTDRRRKIGRRGLAKRNWSVIGKMVPRGGTGSAMGVNDIGLVRWGGTKRDPVLTIRNELLYAMDALKGGQASIDESMAAAASSMQNRVTKAIEKKMGAK